MFKNKTRYSFLLFIILYVSETNAQQVYVESGFENAYFKDYVNNLGTNTLDLKYSKSQELFIESGFRFNLYKERLKWELGLSYNKYKINTGFYSGNVSIPLTYDLAYFTFKVGINLSIVNEPRFKVQVHSHLSYDGLVSGTSKYENVINNLYDSNTFDRTLIRYHRGLSAEYIISEKISTYINYNVADSFRNNNENNSKQEKYSLHTSAFSFGLLFNIQKSTN